MKLIFSNCEIKNDDLICKTKFNNEVKYIYLINDKDVVFDDTGEIRIKRKYGKNKRLILKI